MFSVVNGAITLNGVPVSQLTEEQRRNAYGRAGDIGLGQQIFDFSTGGSPTGANFDPRYWETYDINRGDSDVVTGYRLRPEYARLEGMWQTGIPTSFGGPGQAIDPSAIIFDEEFGYITPLTNLQQIESSWLEQYLPLMLAAANLGAIGAAGGFGGILGGSAAAAGTDLGVYSGMTTGLDGVTGTLAGEAAGVTSAGMATIPDSLLQHITVPPLDVTNPALASLDGLVGAPWYEQIGQYAMNNPLTTARGVLGAASLINGLSNRNSGQRGTGNTTMNYDLTLPEGVQPFNPSGLLGNYTQRPVSLVPFMSQSSLLGGK